MSSEHCVLLAFGLDELAIKPSQFEGFVRATNFGKWRFSHAYFDTREHADAFIRAYGPILEDLI